MPEYGEDLQDFTPKAGRLAFCGKGSLGLITEDDKRVVCYPDGTRGLVFVGVHLTDKIAPIGSPWSSRNPQVVGQIRRADDVQMVIVDGRRYSHATLFL